MKAPDWDYWIDRSAARLWECLALSVDVEPRELGVDHFLVLQSSQTGSPLLGEQDPDWLRESCQRLQALLKVLEDPPGGLRSGRAKSVQFDSQLKIPGFVEWASSQNWALPDALQALVPKTVEAKAKKAPTAKAASSSKTKSTPAARQKAPAAKKSTKASSKSKKKA